jgi:hypothetical protein
MTKRNFLIRLFLALGAVGLLSPLSAVVAQPPEEISGRVLKEQIEAKASPYIQRLEEKKGRELTQKEKDDIVWRLWTASKQSLEFGNAYAVVDP